MNKKLIYYLGILAVGIVTLIAGVNVANAAIVITPITGTPVEISADTCNGAYTALTGPVITEGIGEVGVGTIILSTPTGFEFNVGQDVTATPGGGDDINLGGGAGVAQTATPLAGSVTFAVTGISTVAGTITFSDIKVRPSAGNCAVPNTGALTFSGTATVAGAAGTLTMIAGTLDHFVVAVAATGVINANIATIITGEDQFNNATIVGYDAGGVNLTATRAAVPIVIAPANIAQGQFTDDGIWTSNITLDTTGTVTVTAEDNGNPLLTGNDIVTVIPVAIANLVCASSGQAGTIYLSWTVPVGVVIGYDVRYLQNTAITSELIWAGAIPFVNNIVPGTPGQPSGQQLVTGLIPSATYFFSVKAEGNDNAFAAISAPTGVTCAIESGASSGTVQVSNPLSAITSPLSGSTSKAETAVTITGNSSDNGVSSIKKVEVSTDGGTTWAEAASVASNNSYGFSWTYNWAMPAEGPHTIKSRATSWVGIVETPGAGISLTILSKSGIIYTGTSTPEQVVSQITSASSIAEIQAVITVLQTQLLSLLQQLLAMLTAQLQH